MQSAQERDDVDAAAVDDEIERNLLAPLCRTRARGVTHAPAGVEPRARLRPRGVS